MNIYTKTGDRGETALLGGARVPKDHIRVEAYGEIDELNSALGVARAARLSTENDAILVRLQSELFSVGATLAASGGSKAGSRLEVVEPAWVTRLEAAIDSIDAQVSAAGGFVLPGGSPGAAALHLARAVCRRAERRAVSLSRREEVPPTIVAYLNRLSDLLFMMACQENALAGIAETPWRP